MSTTAAPSTTLTNTETVAVDIAPAITGGEALGAAALKLITDLQEEANSPDEVKAAEAKNKLAAMDALAIAQQNGDIEAERKAAESA